MSVDVKELLGDLKAEIEAEEFETLSPEEKRLHEIAQRLLRLERDLKVPGVASGADVRVDRLLEEIAKGRF